MAQFELIQGSDRWKRLRKKCIENLYFFNAKILGLEDKIPMTPAAHYGLCRFAERKTGIPEIDNSRIQLIQIWRGAGKSALVTFGRTVQQICANRNISIGIANERQENANAFLATIKQTFETNELLQILFPEVIPDFNKTTWKSDRIVVNRTVPNPVNPTVLAAGAGATVTGVHLNQWIVDDIISQDAAENARAGSFTEIDKANRWIDRLEPLLDRMGHDPISFIGCIGQHEPVLMADGSWKPIKDIQVGDEVWACKKDGSEGFKARTVTGVWPQGKSEVLEIYAAGRTMICTKDHPILTARGRADGVGRTWTNAGNAKGKVEIFEGALAYTSYVPEGWEEQTAAFEKDFCWLLGFLFGDGWNTRCLRPNGDTTYSVFFARSEDEALNARAESLLVKYFGGRMYDDKRGSMRMDNTEAGRTLEQYGLLPGVGAKEKRVPAWLFRESAEARRAFLRGFADADGHWTNKNRAAVEISNKELLNDLCLLARTCFVKTTKITERSRLLQPPNSPLVVVLASYHAAFNFLPVRESSPKYKLRSSKKVGEEEVYDLTIEDGDCAFVVNGFIVGNTPWWIDDCYAYVEKLYTNDEPLRKFTWSLKLPDDRIQRIVLEQAGDLAIFRHYPIDQETGRAVWPEKLPLDKLEAERKRKPVFFAAQYLLQPGAGDASFFDEKWLEERTFEWEGPKQIRWKDTDKKTHFERINELGIIMSVDPAISKKREADNSAIMITGSNGTQTFLLEAWGKRVGATELAHQILEFYVRYKPERIIVETVAYQEALLEILELLRSEHGIHHRLPIFDYKTGSDDKKRVRILGLEPYFRKGLVYVHPASQQDFLNEFRNYPHTKHDDLLDALSMQRSSWERLHSGLGGREESQFGQKWRLRQQEIAAKHRNRRRSRR